MAKRIIVSPKQSLEQIACQQLEYLSTASSMRQLTKDELNLLEAMLKVLNLIGCEEIDATYIPKTISKASVENLVSLVKNAEK
jgi:hypothetical protein